MHTMATSIVNHYPTLQSNGKNPDGPHLDASSLPASQTPVEPPPAYSASPMAPHLSGQPAQPYVYTSSAVLFTQNQYPYQGILVPGNFVALQTAHIRDYLVWSIFNVFFGGLLLGIPAVLCSVVTRARKQEGNVEGATTMSKITLAVNIVITVVFFMLTAFLIVYFVAIVSVLSTTE